MQVRFTEDADEQLDRLPQRLQIRIVEKIEHYAQQRDPLAFAEPLTGSPRYRFRVGDYRVIFEVLHDAIWVLAIKRRDEAYR
jgi:mRNA interferase RelE/StbE